MKLPRREVMPLGCYFLTPELGPRLTTGMRPHLRVSRRNRQINANRHADNIEVQRGALTLDALPDGGSLGER